MVQTEHNIKWAKSRARANLIRSINKGTVPLDPKTKDGQQRIMKLREIYDEVDGCEHFDYKKFSSRLAAVRKQMRANEEPEEPRIKWQKSQAKENLAEAILDGIIDETTPIEDIYNSIEGVELYRKSKLESRFKSLLKTVEKDKSRAEADKIAFDDFASRAIPSLTSHLGYVQWQGSEAQALLLADIEAGKHLTMTKQQLWLSNEEYSRNFPLQAFRDKFWQEIRTAKYFHTLKEKGKKKVADW
jgi:hypothetical protein